MTEILVKIDSEIVGKHVFLPADKQITVTVIGYFDRDRGYVVERIEYKQGCD